MHIGGMKYRYITSDCDAVATVFEYQHYTKNREDAVADVLKAGLSWCFLPFFLQNLLNFGLTMSRVLDLFKKSY